MNFVKILGELVKWAPVLELLKGMFGSPQKALEEVRSWEFKRRAEDDERLRKLEERDDS